MTDQFTHIADVKVGKLKGNSRIYPQFRLPSQYSELAGKKASIYEISGRDGDPAFIISFDNRDNLAAFLGGTHPEGCVTNGLEVPVKPCRGSDSGSNPDSGASFLLMFCRSFSFSKISDLSSVI
jgi:hypothetical protein